LIGKTTVKLVIVIVRLIMRSNITKTTAQF